MQSCPQGQRVVKEISKRHSDLHLFYGAYKSAEANSWFALFLVDSALDNKGTRLDVF